MITAKLLGGLGNQMFQIATAYALALDNNDECAFNFYYKETHRLSSGNSPYEYKKNIYSKLRELPEDWYPKVHYDEPSIFIPVPYHGDMELERAFARPQYFDHRRKEVIDLFKNKEIIATIKEKFENSVSIHVRRGNYALDLQHHTLLDIPYYRKALEYIRKRAQIDVIYIFTENKIKRTQDLLWCQKNFKSKKIIFVSGNPDYVDLYMMSLCKHNIIANSSFSWWGSYLNENEEKIICSPAIWFPLANPSPDSFFCDNWTLIEN